MDEWLARIAARKAELDDLRSRGALTSRLDRVVDLELTYALNAIEGNTLTQIETTLVIEEGLTIGGKPIRQAASSASKRTRSISITRGSRDGGAL